MSGAVTNELLLEHLKVIQSKISALEQRQLRNENDISAIKSHVAGLVKSDLNRGANAASL